MKDGEVETYVPGRAKHLALLAGALLLALVGARQLPSTTGVAGLGFFGLCAAVLAAQLVPGSSYLKLGPDGIEQKVLWRIQRHAWSDIERFGICEPRIPVVLQRTVGFKTRSGLEHELADTYGWKIEALVAHLAELHEKYR